MVIWVRIPELDVEVSSPPPPTPSRGVFQLEIGPLLIFIFLFSL